MCHTTVPDGAIRPTVSVRETLVPTRDGRVLPATLALPNGAPRGGVLIVSDALGRSGFYEHLATLLANEGFLALVPDYFFRVSPLKDDAPETRRARRRNELDETQVLRDRSDGLTWLAMQPDLAGRACATLGFCMGGTLAFDLAVEWPDLRAAVSFYGYATGEPGKALVPPPRPLDICELVRASVLCHWGDQDPGYQANDVAELERRMSASNVEHTVRIHPGLGHGFIRESLETAESPAHTTARAAWTETVEFLHAKLHQ
ncbi:MAG: dienelactone hydrolase family protein [Chloroflexota bacterium]